ncbi:LON peptidase substrate-binding domain-containing protein [Actinophytocola gossypii]|uniref:LON peptidase substrate-binding domain-containing protein n=1 Tax=Actinophytocola gossypii TaxID=2812003 RepID=A0ABT2JBL1_9PSEU|nr:LON peptidase substrate-binding domain-containing protein [Actinophytocola gossypii]MCT2585268.1 LON peptidase substrate-binding domain-containing protein [Actinophytocola gossypii]
MPETLPLFPLQTVLLPGTTLPLHIFEPRYRQLTVDLITGTLPDKRFGVVALAPSHEAEVTSRDQLQEIGCAALLRQATRLPDGRFDIVTAGERRFRLLAVDATSAPYLMGAVEWVPDTPAMVPGQRNAADAIGSLVDAARAAYRRYCQAAWQQGDWREPDEDVEIEKLAHLLATDCLLPLEDRQRLLEETRPLHRLRLAGRLLNREAGILSTLRAVPGPPAELRRHASKN